VNRYDSYLAGYLAANKEVALEKIGTLRITTDYPDPNTPATSVSFVCDKKTSTSSGLIDFIAERSGKLRSLIESDLESHLTQAREFLNIGKTYEVLNAGFIKSNSRGEYEFTPYPQTGKPQKIHSQPVKTSRRSNNRSGIQVFALIIVIAIIGGIGWEAYQFYIKPKTGATQNIQADTNTVEDSIAKVSPVDSQAAPIKTYNPDDSVTVHYIFEITDLRLRAKSRTAQLTSFGNPAAYDSSVNGNRKLYSIYIYKKTRIADTLAVKDSLKKFLQKDIQIQKPKQ
jgi:nucleoid DNA-binding protein